VQGAALEGGPFDMHDLASRLKRWELPPAMLRIGRGGLFPGVGKEADSQFLQMPNDGNGRDAGRLLVTVFGAVIPVGILPVHPSDRPHRALDNAQTRITCRAARSASSELCRPRSGKR
jgi:hypothetical protein